jgi:hypothetical protein
MSSLEINNNNSDTSEDLNQAMKQYEDRKSNFLKDLYEKRMQDIQVMANSE